MTHGDWLSNVDGFCVSTRLSTGMDTVSASLPFDPGTSFTPNNKIRKLENGETFLEGSKNLFFLGFLRVDKSWTWISGGFISYSLRGRNQITMEKNL